MRISGSRAGVARYVAEPPATTAIVIETATNAAHTAPNSASRRRRTAAEQDDQGKRPQPVELLLDGQRPVVVER